MVPVLLLSGGVGPYLDGALIALPAPAPPTLVLLLLFAFGSFELMRHGEIDGRCGLAVGPLAAFLALVRPAATGVTVVLYLGYHLACWAAARRQTRTAHQQTESHARALVLRDPNALVGFEQLAWALERQGREAEALNTLKRWQARDPHNREVARRIRRLRASLGPRIGG